MFWRITDCQSTLSVLSIGTWTVSLTCPLVITSGRCWTPFLVRRRDLESIIRILRTGLELNSGVLSPGLKGTFSSVSCGLGESSTPLRDVVGNGVVIMTEAEGHCVEVILGAVDAV